MNNFLSFIVICVINCFTINVSATPPEQGVIILDESKVVPIQATFIHELTIEDSHNRVFCDSVKVFEKIMSQSRIYGANMVKIEKSYKPVTETDCYGVTVSYYNVENPLLFQWILDTHHLKPHFYSFDPIVRLFSSANPYGKLKDVKLFVDGVFVKKIKLPFAQSFKITEPKIIEFQIEETIIKLDIVSGNQYFIETYIEVKEIKSKLIDPSIAEETFKELYMILNQ